MLNSMNRKTQTALFQKISRTQILILFLLALLTSCKSTLTPKVLRPSFNGYLERGALQFNGLLVVDPIASDTLLRFNHDKYFIPASNVKIFTLFAGSKLLRPLVPALKYELSNNILYVQPTGNPTFLNPNFGDSIAFNFLKKYKKIALISNNYDGEKFMPGWAWKTIRIIFHLR